MIHFGSLNDLEISKLEQIVAVCFPEDYKSFLVQTNGGIPKEGYLALKASTLEEDLLINSFLGVNEDDNFDFVGWNEEYGDELPDSTFIFGIEYGGGMFIHITEGEDKGVYFWDSNWSFPESSEDENVYFLADSFSDFLSMVIFKRTL
ncbi:hypothetical protein BU202_02020 [Streptococcus cuniculi]|uniref:Knr4/Smi1-like domain-containing protein n=1 Tax=Streptococcus cuniculi TaxID=1432788 RepID=A0A1Q8EA47_9STRE|nr:hypothetical protein BU202_02020 [Streptococcus cuniculi]